VELLIPEAVAAEVEMPAQKHLAVKAEAAL
jgi:hypothetical protein